MCHLWKEKEKENQISEALFCFQKISNMIQSKIFQSLNWYGEILSWLITLCLYQFNDIGLDTVYFSTLACPGVDNQSYIRMGVVHLYLCHVIGNIISFSIPCSTWYAPKCVGYWSVIGIVPRSLLWLFTSQSELYYWAEKVSCRKNWGPMNAIPKHL